VSAQARFDAATGALIASGDWRAAAAAALPRLDGGTVRVVDGAGITRLDTNGAWLLLNAAHGSTPALRGFDARHLALMQLVAEHLGATASGKPARARGMLAQMGCCLTNLWNNLVGLLDFIGRLTREWLLLFAQPGRLRWREFGGQLNAQFIGAIPIIAGMLFLLGVVFAYLLGDQAQQYGANIFVVDGLLQALLREISPVIVAILVAGRTGAAITAQIGSMKVADEIDAITTLGLSPFSVLVMPRILALLIAMPLLVFIGDIAGMAGGMLIAAQQLDIAPSMFIDRVEDVLKLKTLLIGLLKAPVFAVFIGLIACRMGMTVARDARSVGEHTTSTVVQSVIMIIVLNALFAVLFVQFNL
jgi:ABC-type transport system involved in resistance to organic solvents, permease component